MSELPLCPCEAWWTQEYQEDHPPKDEDVELDLLLAQQDQDFYTCRSTHH